MIYGQPITFGGASGEISITENGTHDVKKYATANVNVAPVLLWTNASPTSAFAAQTVSLPSGYDAYLVEVRYYIYNDKTGVGYLRMSDKYQVLSAHNNTNPDGGGASRRLVNTVTSSGIAFGNGYDGMSESTVNNTVAIPTRIWGVKFTL